MNQHRKTMFIQHESVLFFVQRSYQSVSVPKEKDLKLEGIGRLLRLMG